jgi:regulator of sigma E protease
MLAQPPLWLVILAFIAAIGPLVFFHELGHFTVGRLFGVGAEIFSIGFGREILGWTDRKGTRWKIGWLPIGGYVKFMGDEADAGDSESRVPPEASFANHPLWQRFLIVLAGPAANFLLAIVIFAAVFSLVSAPVANKIGPIEPSSAAATANLQTGDRIVAVAGQPTSSFDDVRSIVEKHPSQIINLSIEREGSVQQIPVKLGTIEGVDEQGKKVPIGLLGVGAAPVSIFEAVPLATVQTVRITGLMINGVAELVIGEGSREDVGGPIRIAQFAGQAASLGLLPFLGLLALLSINLGFINLLPVPMLDGGHLFFYTVEAVRRRPISVRTQEWAFRGGLALILVLLLFATMNDLGSVGLWERLGRLIG